MNYNICTYIQMYLAAGRCKKATGNGAPMVFAIAVSWFFKWHILWLKFMCSGWCYIWKVNPYERECWKRKWYYISRYNAHPEWIWVEWLVLMNKIVYCSQKRYWRPAVHPPSPRPQHAHSYYKWLCRNKHSLLLMSCIVHVQRSNHIHLNSVRNLLCTIQPAMGSMHAPQ